MFPLHKVCISPMGRTQVLNLVPKLHVETHALRLLWWPRQAVSGSGERILIGAASSNCLKHHLPRYMLFWLAVGQTDGRVVSLCLPLLVWNLWPLRFDQMSCSWPQRMDPWGARWQRQMAFENSVFKMLIKLNKRSISSRWMQVMGSGHWSTHSCVQLCPLAFEYSLCFLRSWKCCGQIYFKAVPEESPEQTAAAVAEARISSSHFGIFNWEKPWETSSSLRFTWWIKNQMPNS